MNGGENIKMDFKEPDRDYDCIKDFKFTEDQVEAIEFALDRMNCILVS